jgi:hypothetical protein
MKATIYLILLSIFSSASLQAQKVTQPNTTAIADSLKTVFYKDAKRAGLTTEKTKELLKIIDERNKVIADFDAKKKRYYAPFSVMDPDVAYTYKIDIAQKLYAKKIKNLLNYEQYFQFIDFYFRDEAEQKAKEEMYQLTIGNPALTDEQKIKLYDLIYNHYLNFKVSYSYYNGDFNLQKSKQAGLTFVFEKRFAEMCKEFNIKIEKIRESSANNFQWN